MPDLNCLEFNDFRWIARNGLSELFQQGKICTIAQLAIERP
jgi:hypothetical protein